MKAHTYQKEYELVEFNLYLDNSKDATTVVDMVVESDDIDNIATDFGKCFIVDTDKTSYVFYNYELSEYYKIGGGLIRLVYVK